MQKNYVLLYPHSQYAMARLARKQSGTGIYHVMLRGNNQQGIFEDQEDYQRLLLCLRGLCVQITGTGFLIHRADQPVPVIQICWRVLFLPSKERRFILAIILFFSELIEAVNWIDSIHELNRFKWWVESIQVSNSAYRPIKNSPSHRKNSDWDKL